MVDCVLYYMNHWMLFFLLQGTCLYQTSHNKSLYGNTHWSAQKTGAIQRSQQGFFWLFKIPNEHTTWNFEILVYWQVVYIFSAYWWRAIKTSNICELLQFWRLAHTPQNYLPIIWSQWWPHLLQCKHYYSYLLYTREFYWNRGTNYIPFWDSKLYIMMASWEEIYAVGQSCKRTIRNIVSPTASAHKATMWSHREI